MNNQILCTRFQCISCRIKEKDVEYKYRTFLVTRCLTPNQLVLKNKLHNEKHRQEVYTDKIEQLGKTVVASV